MSHAAGRGGAGEAGGERGGKQGYARSCYERRAVNACAYSTVGTSVGPRQSDLRLLALLGSCRAHAAAPDAYRVVPAAPRPHSIRCPHMEL